MSTSRPSTVGPSRAGDQFHYTWTARRCLALLPPNSELVAISVEGASSHEEAAFEGEDVIDIAEYYGSESLAAATKVRVFQFKHSTLRSYEPMTASAFVKTLDGFLKRFIDLAPRYPNVVQEFCILTNRPISQNFIETLEDIAKASDVRHSTTHTYLLSELNPQGTQLRDFCRCLRIDGSAPNLSEQAALLHQDVASFLSAADHEAATQLKELVARRASSASRSNPSIRRADVLRALNVEPEALFPAPNEILPPTHFVARKQESDLWRTISESQSGPILLHAEGGVGKSVIANRIALGLPEGSKCVVFDCFGNGSYRRASSSRHLHSVALVQIVNELACANLCNLILPRPGADTHQYIRTFLARLREAISIIRDKHSQALLCVVVDAADNAEIVAKERHEQPSFIKDLLKETLPEGIRLVALCRSHRRHLLDLPTSTVEKEIRNFCRDETASHLRATFHAASESDVDEFHRLTSQNPRVQSMAIETTLAESSTVQAMLRGLGPTPVTIENAIQLILDRALARVRDSVGAVEKEQIDRICEGLASLRPFVPVQVLAEISGVPEGAIRSFAFDLGRSLLLTADSIQIIDEPTETWFKERFRPKPESFKTFVQRLKPLAAAHYYVSISLPQIMLEAGQLDELIELALSDESLPTNPLHKREARNERLQFALKAALRANRATDACKLAFVAAIETVGSGRQAQLYRENTDLAAKFLSQDRAEEIVATRVLADDRQGSRYAYESALLSHFPELKGDVRSRFRIAQEQIESWLKNRKEHDPTPLVTDELLADLAMAILNVAGPARTANFLRSWRPREISTRVGSLLGDRLIDHGRFLDIEALCDAAGNDAWLVLGLTRALRRVHRYPPTAPVRRSFRILRWRSIIIQPKSDWYFDNLDFVACFIETSIKLQIGSPKQRAEILSRHIPETPPRFLFERTSRRERLPVLNAYVLLALSEARQLDPLEVAHAELKKELLDKKRHHRTQEGDEFSTVSGSLLPWLELRARVITGELTGDSLRDRISRTIEEVRKVLSQHYSNRDSTLDDSILTQLSLCIEGSLIEEPAFKTLTDSIERAQSRLFIPTFVALVRGACAHPMLGRQGLAWAKRLRELIDGYREGADSKIGAYIDLCRAILPISQQGARDVFNTAVEISTRLGDEHVERWTSLLEISDSAEDRTNPSPELAYRMARAAELIYEYIVRDKYFDWEGTIRTICGLCPRSGIAILSRWRDREFGSQEDLLPESIRYLVSRSHLKARVALSLYPIRGYWRRAELLENAISETNTREVQENILRWFLGYCVLDDTGRDDWQQIDAVVKSTTIDLPQFRPHIANAVLRREARHTRDKQKRTQTTPDKPILAPALVLDDLDLRTPNGVAAALERRRSDGTYVDDQAFFKQVVKAVKPGSEPQFIAALAALPRTGWLDLSSLITQFPTDWIGLPGVNSALADAIKIACRRSCLSFNLSRGWNIWPMEKARHLSGLSEREMVGAVVDAIAHTQEKLTPSRLFSLAGLLARLIEPHQAKDALLHCLDTLDRDMRPEHGDGAWCSELIPPASMEECIAGYIWAALGATSDTVRWQSAHVVRGWGRLGLTEPLDHLLATAGRGNPGPFVDAKQRFYELHAKQWLTLSLERMSLEAPSIAARYWGHIYDAAVGDLRHSMINGIAARTALSLLRNGIIEGLEVDRERLLSINKTPFETIEEQHHGSLETPSSQHEEPRSFLFEPDIGPYWLAPLAHIFAMPRSAIQATVLAVMQSELGFSGDSRWKNDERIRRGQFQDGTSLHSHGSYPKKDDEYFYCAYHSMMIAAVVLLESRPLAKPRYESIDPFDDWLQRHSLTLADGRWLADCRDPAPLTSHVLGGEPEQENWNTSISRDSFLDVMFAGSNRYCVWGNWTETEGSRNQEADVTSALVAPESAPALLRALQTAENFHCYRLPTTSDNDFTYRRGEYRLRGWISAGSHNCDLGRRDPWSGKISDRTYRLARFVTRSMGLKASDDGRQYSDVTGIPVVWLSVWGRWGDEEATEITERGNRILIERDFLLRFLRRVKRDLIVEIELKREQTQARYGRHDNGTFEYESSYVRLVLIRQDGEILAL